MRVAVITGYHPADCIGGAELQAHLLAKGLAETAPTYFLAVDSHRSSITEEENGLVIVRLRSMRTSATRLRILLKTLRDIKPEVLYCRTLYFFWSILLAGRMLGIPVVYHVSSIADCEYRSARHLRAFSPSVAWLKKLKRYLRCDFNVFASCFADSIICQTVEQKKLFRRNLGRRSTVIPNGHPVPEPPNEKQSRPFKVVWIGKHWKNPDVFHRLAERFKDDPDFEFLMVGTFPPGDADSFRKKSADNPCFRFIGRLENDEVNKLLEESHVIVNTSEYEGFSNTFIQAWMRGALVLSLNVDPDDVIKRNSLGAHCGSFEALKDKISLFKDNLVLFQQVSDNCYRFGVENFNIKKSVEALGKLLSGYRNYR